MAEITETPPTPKRRLRILRDNPVAIKELRSRMRGRRAFVVLTTYLTIMSLFIALIYIFYAQLINDPYGPDARQAGKAVFGAVIAVEIFLAIFIAPAFTAGAISGEKERQTYDLLRTTLLPANWFVIGKLTSSLSYVFLLILASIPLQSIAFLLGGLSLEELLISQLLIILGAITFAMFGLYCSSVMKSTLAASVATIGGALFATIGIPIIVLMSVSFFGALFLTNMTMTWVGEAFMAYGALLLAATNLPVSLVASELLLIEQNTLFFFSDTLSGRTLWFFSPWIGTVVLYTIAALFLYWICVRRVRRTAVR